ncbi:hypothetical protein NC652_030996 [Populus alba x Populus x berolinensis]|nr:hypothetical protein NC652_030996 [Populus alba x Populus x berolinensis]
MVRAIDNVTERGSPVAGEPVSLISRSVLYNGIWLMPVSWSVRILAPWCTRNCSNQTYNGSTESHSQTLSSLFQELLPQSSTSKFFKTTAGDEDVGISAFFQCRNDLRNDECYNCVNTLPKVSNSLCKQALAARVHLDGCYFKYETDGLVEETSTRELLHQTCSEERVEGHGFEEGEERSLRSHGERGGE